MASPSWFGKEALREYGLDLVRAYLGVALLVKGVAFASRQDVLHTLLQQHDLTLSGGILAHYVIGAHICGGFLLAVGLLTRIAALVQVPVLAGAVMLVHRKEGLFSAHQSLELTLLVLFLLLVIGCAGAGKLSLDYVLAKGKLETARA